MRAIIHVLTEFWEPPAGWTKLLLDEEGDCLWQSEAWKAFRRHYYFLSLTINELLSHEHLATRWPAVWWPGSADGRGAGAAAGLLSAAWSAAAGLHIFDEGTGQLCSEVCGGHAGLPAGWHDGPVKPLQISFQHCLPPEPRMWTDAHLGACLSLHCMMLSPKSHFSLLTSTKSLGKLQSSWWQ